MDDRVVDVDDLSVDLDRVGQEDLILEDAHEALGDGGLAVSGGAVEEDLRVRTNGRAELVEGLVGEDEIVEDLAQAGAVDLVLGGLAADGVGVSVERYGDGPDVLAHLVAVLGDAAAGLRQRQNVVVAVHALDFDVLLLAQVVEDVGGDAGMDAQAA